MQNSIFEAHTNGLKNKVINILSNDKYITAKQLHLKLQRQHGVTSTYQATHKALKQMLSENILLKEKTAYYINPEWAENFKKKAEQLAEKVKNNSTKEIFLEDLNEGESVQISLKGILEVGWFLIDKIMIAPNPSDKPCIALWRFCYSLLGLEAKHLNGLKTAIKKNNWFIFVEENNKIDKLFGETLLSYGVKEIKYNVKCSTPLSDKVIIGDYITEISYPSFFRKLWAIQNRLPKKIIEFKLAKHILLMREIQPATEVTITKNSKLAEEYRKEYLKI